MSFIQFVRIMWARRWIVIISTLGCFIAALIAAALLPTRYEASSRVMMELLRPDPITGQVSAAGFARAYTKTQTELIRDYRVTGAVVDRLGWTNSPQFLASFNRTAGAGEGDFRRWLAQIIASGTTARNIEGSNILEITYSANSPETAAAVANTIRDAYIEQALASKREGARGSAQWLDGQLVKVRALVSAAEERKTNFERTNRIILQDDNSEAESERLRALAGQQIVSPAAVAAGAAMSPSAIQLATLDARIASESATLGPNHPEIQTLRQQRAITARVAAQEAAASRQMVGGGPSIEGQVAAQTARVLSQRSKVEEARRLNTDVAVLRDQYAKTAARAAEFRQQSESDDSGLTLLGSAVVPENPVFPNIPLIIFGSLGIGFVFGVLASLVTELLSRRIRGAEDLALPGVPMIVMLNGWSATQPRRSLFQRLRLARTSAA